MKRIYYIGFLMFSLLVSSCNDFLTEEPKHQFTTDNAITSYSNAQNAVNGMYSIIEYYKFGGEIHGSLACQAGFWDYSTYFLSMDYKSTRNTTDGIWKSLYNGVNAANATITGISSLNASIFPSEKEKNNLIAEARCFRGYMNLQLLWYFARWFDKPESVYGIIYRDQPSNLSNLMVERSTVGQSYQYIIDDLQYAINNLHDYTSAKYMSKQFAQVMYAKLLMVRGANGDYAKALELVNDVMAHSPATFTMEKNINDLYTKGWDSSEVLFARYLGDSSQMTYLEFMYSYALYYNNQFKEPAISWLKADKRYNYTFGKARAPETWDTTTKDNVLTKLYHRGRYEGPNDMYTSYIFRYAELYLMKAELLARTNPTDIAGALAMVNKMRAQYTTPVLDPLTANTYDELMEVIFKEYVVTLFLENETPWFASLRFMKDGKPWIYALKPDVNFGEDKYCWPIPESEINAHTNTIKQNPGVE